MHCAPLLQLPMHNSRTEAQSPRHLPTLPVAIAVPVNIAKNRTAKIIFFIPVSVIYKKGKSISEDEVISPDRGTSQSMNSWGNIAFPGDMQRYSVNDLYSNQVRLRGVVSIFCPGCVVTSHNQNFESSNSGWFVLINFRACSPASSPDSADIITSACSSSF